MEKNYNKINSIINIFKYKRISKKIDIDMIDNEDIDENETNEINITSDELVERIKLIPIEDIYMYLLETIQKFMLTWYGKKIIIDINDKTDGIIINGLTQYKFNYESYFIENISKDDLHKYGVGINFPETLTVKYKFIYNFAKAFVLGAL